MIEVTIVLPAWDQYVRYLAATIESIQMQEPSPRILVVDNCSMVPVHRLPHVDVVRTRRRLTIGGARSYGLSLVQTEFVLFWDADDIMKAETVAVLVARMRAEPDLSLLATRIEEGGSRHHHWPRSFTPYLAQHRNLLALAHSISAQVPTIGAMMRTETVRDAGGFPDMETGDDWVLGMSIAFRGRVDVDNHYGRIYYQHLDSTWANRQTPRHLIQHARAVRARISADPAAPWPIRRMLPVIAFGQWLVIWVLRPLARVFRR